MRFSSTLIESAVSEFSKLPGVGKKTALRFVLHLLKQDIQAVSRFTESISSMRNQINYCSVCHNVSDHQVCNICSDTSRKKGLVCVVETIRDVIAIEATQHYSGLYHVLGGIISPLEGIGPDSLQIDSLIRRVTSNEINEVIMALSPTVEGDTTSFFIQKKLKEFAITISTLSRGVAFGGELEYADELTLARSIMNRVPLKDAIKTSL